MSAASRTTNRAWISFLACAAFARQAPQICGTAPYQAIEEAALHRAHTAKLRAKPKSAAVRDASRDVGNIYVLEDNEGIASRRNPFNLDRRSISFQPSAAGHVYRVAPSDFDQAASDAGSPIVNLDDDDTRELPLPFEFPFHGKTYTTMHVNSDGNITFEEADGLTVERSLGRTIAGPPRIAPFYTDLDPARANASVRVFTDESRVVVTWANVPEYTDFGGAPRNTFQVRLSRDGRIDFAFSSVLSRTAVTGIAPGRGSAVTAVEFSNAPEGSAAGAVVENFSNIESIDLALAAQSFLRAHDDSYDFIAFYNNAGVEARSSVVAIQVSVRSAVEGIGDAPRDDGAIFGSPKRLLATLNMGPLSQYQGDPEAFVSRRFPAGDTPLTVLGHEVGHLWLALVSTREGNSSPMLAANLVHWNFLFNSEASLLEGNRIRDNGDGASPRFTNVATVEGYSPFDQYLMGFRAPEEVPPSFYVTRATTSSVNRFPQAGVSYDGVRRDVDVPEIVAIHGRRAPDHTVSQRRFRMAIVLIARPGAGPEQREIDQLERLRQAFEPFFERAAGGRAAIDTTRRPGIELSVAPAAGVLAGQTVSGSVAVAQARREPLTVTLRGGGFAAIPATVTSPAGQRRAAFSIRGGQAGVSAISAEAEGFAPAYANIQVLADGRALRPVIVSGGRQTLRPGALPDPVVFRAVDGNGLPYSGITVGVAVSRGGSVQPASAVTAEDGTARFRWTPGAGPVYELRATIPGGSAPAIASVTGALPTIAADGVVNAASFKPGLVPGGLATMFGAQFAPGATTVTAGGRAAVVLASTDRQINFVAPASTPPGETEVVARTATGPSGVQRVPVRAVDPGIFFNAATGLGAVRSGDGFLEVYATGLGALAPSDRHPGLQETAQITSATLGGATAEVLYSGPAPGIAGLYQVNVRIPAGMAGVQTLRIEVGGVPGNEVRVDLR